MFLFMLMIISCLDKKSTEDKKNHYLDVRDTSKHSESEYIEEDNIELNMKKARSKVDCMVDYLNKKESGDHSIDYEDYMVGHCSQKK